MNNKRLIIIILVATGLTLAGITTHHILATSETWYRIADDCELAPIDSGMSYLYYPDTMAGVVERVEPTPEDFVSDIRKTDVWYYSDSNNNLCRTYISWDADLEPGDHMTLSVRYKYRVDMDSRDGLDPTFLVDREVIDFQVVKKEAK